MILLEVLFLLVMLYGAIIDWKYRLVYIKTWVSTSILSLIIASLRGYTLHQIISFSSWLFIFFIIVEIVCTVIYKLKDRPFLINRNINALNATISAFKSPSQENIDVARGLIFNSSNSRELNAKLDNLQKSLNESENIQALLTRAAKKIELAEISNTGVDLYTAASFMNCIPKNNRKDLYKRLNILPDKVVDEADYGLGWGDIAIAPSVTLFYGVQSTYIMLIVLILALIGQKLIKQTDEDSIPFVTYLAIGCLIEFIINL